MIGSVVCWWSVECTGYWFFALLFAFGFDFSSHLFLIVGLTARPPGKSL